MQKLINRGHVVAKGFTLIELLVVIAIIGILAGIVLASLGSARSGANDAKSKEQLSGLRSAMESYYASNGNYGASATACNAGAFATSGISPLVTASNYTGTLKCGSSGTAWAVNVTLTSGYFCVDSSGSATTTGTDTLNGTAPDTAC